MRNMFRTALIIGTLATPMIAMADTPKKDAPAAKDAAKDAPKDKAGDMKDAPAAKDAPPAKDAKAPKKDATKKKDVKEPAPAPK